MALVVRGEFDELEASKAIMRLLLEGVAFNAVFAGGDDAAAGVISTLKLSGRLVPDDVSVVGFDDIPLARFLSPR